MSDSFRSLYRKWRANTLTPEKQLEFEKHIDEYSQKQYDICPICGGAFQKSIARKQPFECPNCGTTLRSYAFDVVPHQLHEIDPATPESHWLGEFVVGYVPEGCHACFCGETFPESYSCCPGLLVLAVELLENGSDSQKKAALSYVQTHYKTFLNCLRGQFNDRFSKISLRKISR